MQSFLHAFNCESTAELKSLYLSIRADIKHFDFGHTQKIENGLWLRYRVSCLQCGKLSVHQAKTSSEQLNGVYSVENTGSFRCYRSRRNCILKIPEESPIPITLLSNWSQFQQVHLDGLGYFAIALGISHYLLQNLLANYCRRNVLPPACI